MRRIERHGFQIDDIRRHIEHQRGDVRRRIDLIKVNPRALRGVVEEAVLEVEWRSVVDSSGGDPAMGECVSLAAAASAGLFAAAGRVEGEVECVLRGTVHRVRAIGPTHDTGTWRWLRGFFLALTCRDRSAADTLAAVPTGLLYASEPDGDDYMFEWVAALGMFWRGEPAFEAVAERALTWSDPAKLRRQDKEAAAHLLIPPIEVFLALTSGSADEFNGCLAGALEQHRDYWSRDVENRPRDPSGFIAWPLLGLACLARDRGVPVEVESEYLPARFVDRSRAA